MKKKNNNLKKTEIKQENKTNIEKTKNKEFAEQISSESLIEKQETHPARTAETEIIELSEELEEIIPKTILSVNLSDQAKTVLELFDGKIISN